ncbi:hypothetical protein AVEN_216626-1 [Araneus ventricosus]|uniref:Uncharacterized protein n=1 Tax=Araneus ventricosus TaxID=182803 RepID=A0A4Y2DV49_ARAVE|nr:hypothetical protein AVEN_216626-1 [Araneus ventricosus]
MNSFFPGHSASDDFFYTPVMDSVETIKLEDLELVFNNLKGERNNIIFYTQAFADDLALIISGRTARELEANTNIALAEIAQHLQEIKL